jgi:hypothetical protein
MYGIFNNKRLHLPTLLANPKIMVLQKKIEKNRCSKHLAAPTVIDRPMAIDSGWSKRKKK